METMSFSSASLITAFSSLLFAEVERLVHRQSFQLPELEPTVAELSVDGGDIPVRTPGREPSAWQGYKAVYLHDLKTLGAAFGDNVLINAPQCSISRSHPHLFSRRA